MQYDKKGGQDSLNHYSTLFAQTRRRIIENRIVKNLEPGVARRFTCRIAGDLRARPHDPGLHTRVVLMQASNHIVSAIFEFSRELTVFFMSPGRPTTTLSIRSK